MRQQNLVKDLSLALFATILASTAALARTLLTDDCMYRDVEIVISSPKLLDATVAFIFNVSRYLFRIIQVLKAFCRTRTLLICSFVSPLYFTSMDTVLQYSSISSD